MAIMSEEGRALHRTLLENEKRIASELYHTEVQNGFWGFVHVGRMTKALADELIGKAIALVDEFVPMAENENEAFAAACQYDHPVSDMYHLTLARRYDATLYTLDKRLQRVCDKAQVKCIQLVDPPEDPE